MIKQSVPRPLYLCLLIAILLLAGCEAEKPPSAGVFLKEQTSYAELKRYEGVPEPDQYQAFPRTTNHTPTITVWQPGIKADMLAMVSLTKNETIDIKVSVQQEGILEVQPRKALDAGVYCLFLGDPLEYLVPNYCFQVEGSALNVVPGPLAS